MAEELPSWPVTCREATARLAELAGLLEQPFAGELDVIQDAARRLALNNVGAARRALEPADGPMDPMRRLDY